MTTPQTSNLNLYIPRASLLITQGRVVEVFAAQKIGKVLYCDFVQIKNSLTQEPSHMSVFVTLDHWDYNTMKCYDFSKNQNLKIYLQNNVEHWIILPNPNPLPRTHVNIHQLAASTEKLFESIQVQKELNSELREERDVQKTQFEEMREMFIQQQDQIKELFEQNRILEKELEIVQRELKWSYTELRNMHSKTPTPCPTYVNNPHPYIKKDDYLKEENAIVDRLIEESLQEETPAGADPAYNEMKVLMAQMFYPHLLKSGESKNQIVDECIFSSASNSASKKQVPANVQGKRTPSLAEIITKNPERAVESRDYCGNF